MRHRRVVWPAWLLCPVFLAGPEILASGRWV